MKTNLLISSAAMALVLCSAGCRNNDPSPTVQRQPHPPPASGSCQPEKELAGLDLRTPVPLQPMMAWHQKQNMMEHLVAIQRITDSLARQDWKELESASALIESSPQMQQMCQHMGAGAQGFTEMALEFHRRADAIGKAARAHDGPAALRATSDTLQSCNRCHAAFRQDIVSATEWQRRTGSRHDPAIMHGEH